MGGGMMGAGCATCHGSDGHGRTTPTFTSPNITYGNLTDPAGHADARRYARPAYTDASIKTAVTQGIDPEGGHGSADAAVAAHRPRMDRPARLPEDAALEAWTPTPLSRMEESCVGTRSWPSSWSV